MPADGSGIGDEVYAELNGTPDPKEDAKGPDPVHWPVENRDSEPEYKDEDLKGPDPAVWGE